MPTPRIAKVGLAYNLLKWMALLTGGVIQQWEVKTMRLWLIRVAGKLIKGGRQLTLKLPEKFLHQEEWRAWEGISLSVAFGQKMIVVFEPGYFER